MNNTVPIDFDFAEVAAHGGAAAPSGAPLAPAAPAERHLRLAPEKPAVARRALQSPLIGSLVAVAVILVILAVQLGLSIAVSQGAYETRALELEQRDLSRVERVLSQHVDKLSSPQNLAQNAAALGMVQNARPATLRLSDGAVLGNLASETSEARGNLIANATLDSLPVIETTDPLVPGTAQPPAVQPEATASPVRWEGKLPAPDTH